MKHMIAATSAAFIALSSLHTIAAESIAQGTTLAQESQDQWRSSKLVGVPIYGPDDKSVGKITDMLMGKDGKVAFVVIGVGGFLGIGEKDVAVPFAAVDFSDKPIPQPAMPVGNNLAAPSGASQATMPANGGIAPATTVGLGSQTDPTVTGMVPAGGMTTTASTTASPSTAYPDHGTIAMNKDQLKQAPSFQFAQ